MTLNAAAPERASTAARAPLDPAERDLARASILALTPRGEPAAGVFDATIKLPGSASRERARLAIALLETPTAHRRPLAFYRLANALGAHVVPISAESRVGAGDLADLLEGQPAALRVLKFRSSILNDGTLAVLLTSPSAAGDDRSPWGESRGRAIAVSGAAEFETWAAWSAHRAPAPFENTRLLRDYVEMLALDYLAANVLRKTAVLDDANGSLLLVDNATAFPLDVDPRALDRLLGLLRECARFPRSLRDRLARFDRASAAAVFQPGSFDTWLLTPRSLVALEERRAGLLTLIEARIAESTNPGEDGGPTGEDAVLSL